MRSRATLAWLSLGLTPTSEHGAQARRRHLLPVPPPPRTRPVPVPPARPSYRPSLFRPTGLPPMCLLSSSLSSCAACDRLMSSAHRQGISGRGHWPGWELKPFPRPQAGAASHRECCHPHPQAPSVLRSSPVLASEEERRDLPPGQPGPAPCAVASRGPSIRVASRPDRDRVRPVAAQSARQGRGCAGLAGAARV